MMAQLEYHPLCFMSKGGNIGAKPLYTSQVSVSPRAEGNLTIDERYTLDGGWGIPDNDFREECFR